EIDHVVYIAYGSSLPLVELQGSEGNGSQQELRHIRSDEITAAVTAKDRLRCHVAANLRPTEISECREGSSRCRYVRVGRVGVETDVAQECHPVELGHLGGNLRTIDPRGRRNRWLLGI